MMPTNAISPRKIQSVAPPPADSAAPWPGWCPASTTMGIITNSHPLSAMENGLVILISFAFALKFAIEHSINYQSQSQTQNPCRDSNLIFRTGNLPIISLPILSITITSLSRPSLSYRFPGPVQGQGANYRHVTGRLLDIFESSRSEKLW